MKTHLLLISACALLLGACQGEAAFSPTQIEPGTAAPTKAPPSTAPTPKPTATQPPTATTAAESPTPQSEVGIMDQEAIRITILYDNNGYGDGLQSDWGFSALIEHEGQTVLFDTGYNGTILRMNMETLGVDPAMIETVVLSHAHQDHTGGLDDLLQASLQARVYLLPSFDQAFKTRTGENVEVIEVTPGEEIAPGFRTTGELGISTPEQALIIDTTQGPIVITGCAHPGIVTIVREAVALTGEAPRLVMGGFHLRGKSQERVASLIEDLQEMGVQQVAPCHCTGDQAIEAFASAFQDNFIRVGVGSILELTH